MAIRADDVDLTRDRELVTRSQSGDLEAFADLYSRYFDRLRRYCERRVYDRHVAEELAQETFVRALGALPSFAGERRVYPWLTVIAHRLCVDHHRARQRVEPMAEVELGADDSADEATLRRESLDLLDAALDRVKPRHREVLLLREGEGLSYDDIGDRLGAPRSTVETLLHRARLALRREARAVAGPGGLIAIPVLGTLAGWVGRARRRLAATIGQRHEELGDLSSLSAPMAAVAASLALAIGMPGLDDGPAPVRAQAGPPTADPAGAGTGFGGLDADDVSLVPSTDQAPAVAPVHPVSDPTAGVGGVRVFVGEEGARQAADEAEQMPVNERVGPAFFGVDPDQIAHEVEDTLHSVVGG